MMLTLGSDGKPVYKPDKDTADHSTIFMVIAMAITMFGSLLLALLLYLTGGQKTP